ncbi:hypothetical protein CYMTET_45342 [Cymbomonas tetramitiformis]|uniref:Uncharacterized protein n=1 Tax=Cymbomonas tetramitiformis TaxID=36881 RepID=A0AAE0BYE2_9CHLO|nr:hypothetical protein CYMTET_45342 [Cymbomonas tetramitiformis]
MSLVGPLHSHLITFLQLNVDVGNVSLTGPFHSHLITSLQLVAFTRVVDGDRSLSWWALVGAVFGVASSFKRPEKKDAILAIHSLICLPISE